MVAKTREPEVLPEVVPVPTLPEPGPLETQIMRDWVSYTKISLMRLEQASSAYAPMFSDFADVVDGVVNPDPS